MKARENPFAAQRIEQLRYDWQDGSWQRLFERLAALGHRGALVGPQGAGKTTLLLELGERLNEAGWCVRRLRLSRDPAADSSRRLRDFVTGLDARHFLLLDSAEQLGWPRWYWFARRARSAGGLVITTHRPGRLPTLHDCRTSPELARQLVSQLWGSDELRPLVDQLFRHYRGNVRDVLRALYDLAAADEIRRGTTNDTNGANR